MIVRAVHWIYISEVVLKVLMKFVLLNVSNFVTWYYSPCFEKTFDENLVNCYHTLIFKVSHIGWKSSSFWNDSTGCGSSRHILCYINLFLPSIYSFLLHFNLSFSFTSSLLSFSILLRSSNPSNDLVPLIFSSNALMGILILFILFTC